MLGSWGEHMRLDRLNIHMYMYIHVPVAKSGLVHEFEEAVNLLSDKAVVVHHLGTLLGKVNVTSQSKPLGDGRGER